MGYDGKVVLRDISFDIAPGEIVSLIGPNGAGKSTILKSIARQLKTLAGTVEIDGKPLASMTGRETAARMAVVLTERVRPELMTCRDVVAAGRYPYTGRLGILSREDERQIDAAMRTVHALDLSGRDFNAVSDGQRQRVLLARAICQQPEIIVLDEPTSFLDIRHKLELLDVLKTMVRSRHMAVVMSLHELDLAQKISDRVVCVTDHRIDRCGTPEEIFRDDYIRELYGIRQGSYNALYGNLEMPPAGGRPKVFVIGGGGSGIPVYRLLQRNGIPFAAGVLQENDLDWPAARALAAEVVSVPPYAVPDEAAVIRAKERIEACGSVICCTAVFGEGNRVNRELRDYAASHSLLTDAAAFCRCAGEGGKA